MKNKIAFSITGLALMGSLLAAAPALADDGHGGQGRDGQGEAHMSIEGLVRRGLGIFGTVSSVGSTSLSLSGSTKHGTTTTFSVDASNATITKDGTTTALSGISVGDNIVVQGTINGVNIVANIIRDGISNILPKHKDNDDNDANDDHGKHEHASSTVNFTGNGQPVVGGTVTALGSSTITIINKAGSSFTVNTASSTILNKKGATSTLNVGDNVLVQGTVNGSSITASSVIDSGINATASTTDNGSHSNKGEGKGLGRIFGGLGNFFSRLFGFF